MELDEFHVLQRQSGAQHHPAAIAGAGMRRRGGEIAAAITAGRQHGLVAAETVDRTIIHAQRNHAPAHAVLHDQVECEIFNEKVRVVLQALLIQRVKHRVTGAISSGTGALGGWPLAHILHHAAERALINLALFRAAKRHACVLQLIHSGRCFAAQIFNRVLITQPVGSLDGIVHVPGPVIRPHITQRGRNAALRCDGVAAGREHLGNACRFQARFSNAHRRAQARAARANNNRVIGVIDNLIGSGHAIGAPAAKAMVRIEKMAIVAAPRVKNVSSTISATRIAPCA